MRQKFLDDKLVEYEKLELMLGYIVPRRDVRPLAHGLIKKFGSIGQVLSAPFAELIAFPGVGRNIAIFIKLMYEIILDGYRNELGDRPIFHDINVLKNYCKWLLASKPVEEFHILYLDSDYRLINDETHSTGSFDYANLVPRDIVKNALKFNATSVILMHNHPNTDNGFSQADMDTTEAIQKLLQTIDVQLYDHILVSKYSIYSARNLGLFNKN